jgi:hypothetical protein
MTDLAASCADIATWLPIAQALVTEPDTDGSVVHGKPGSHPPGNAAAMNAHMDAHAGLRRLEALLRLEVTGHTGPRRGGSDANTTAAIEAIEALGNAVTTAAMAQAARVLDRWSRQIQELPAVDEIEPPRRVHGVACPYCGRGMLYVRPREMTVTCPPPCRDSNGQRSVGHMEISRLTADPIIRWADGLVAP